MKLLVSVRDSAEASVALAGGADWIDLKEPNAGPLGAVSFDVAHSIVQVVAGRCPLSAALGELADWPDTNEHELFRIPEISVVKVGLSNCAKVRDWSLRWQAIFSECLNSRRNLAAVIYADWRMACAPTPDEILHVAIETKCRYLLIDTFEKQAGSSISILSLEELARLAHVARQAGMTTVLAGSLQEFDFAQIAELPIELVAVRGAACRANRTCRLDRALVSHLRHRLSEEENRAKELTKSLTSII
jgi:(5-formylfuran-3-yl)methyl phosphate synthase